MNNSDTIAAIATGMSSSGIGIVRISGDDAFRVAERIFKSRSGKKKDISESHHAYYGFIFDDRDMVDEVLLLPMKAPKSFTGEDTVEIDCHGGILVMNRILETVIKNGARIADPGEFTKRAFLNGRIDLSRAEAVIDIINSENKYALDNSLKHLTGKLYDEIKDIREIILYETAFIESALDDPEHISLDLYPKKLRDTVTGLLKRVSFFNDSFSEGRLLSEGIRTVILGKPNVGKSSLLNILLGEERAIVTDIAGTTRDAIEEKLLLDGLTLNIVDTAGIRYTDDPVEKIGVERAFKYADSADLIIMMVDSSNEIDDEDKKIFDYIKDKKSVVLMNKSDLEQVISVSDLKDLTDKKIIQISAKNSEGIKELSDYIKVLFISGVIDYDNEVFISNSRQKELLNRSEQNLKDVIKSIDMDLPEDFYTIDLKNAYEALGGIIGESLEDDVINEIFSKFCMGK